MHGCVYNHICRNLVGRTDYFWYHKDLTLLPAQLLISVLGLFWLIKSFPKTTTMKWKKTETDINPISMKHLKEVVVNIDVKSEIQNLHAEKAGNKAQEEIKRDDWAQGNDDWAQTVIQGALMKRLWVKAKSKPQGKAGKTWVKGSERKWLKWKTETSPTGVWRRK